METFGTVALEAMARGRPALVSENAGIHHWSVLSEALFTLKSEESLATALSQIASLPDSVWKDKAASARQAAETLNRQTIDQWVGFVQKYSKPIPRP
jgi:glycosyltransferase involved in cell wall biosynthesis